MDLHNNNKIKIAAINANSIGTLKKRYDLQKFIDLHNIDICLISETKLNAKHKVQLNNHHIIRTDRPNSTKGGDTAIAIYSKYKYSTIYYPNSSKNKVIEFTAIKIKTNPKTNLTIISIYATQATRQTFIKELHKLMVEFKLGESHNYYIIAGDINAKNIRWGDLTSNDRGDKLIEWIDNNYLELKITLLSPEKPTYPKANSYLDHCLIDMRMDVEDLQRQTENTTV